METIDGQSIIKVDRPIDYTASVMGPFLLNGPAEVAGKGLGTAQWGPIFRAKKDSVTYSTGTRMGPIESSFDLSKGCLFTYIGDDEQEDDLIRVIGDCLRNAITCGGGGGHRCEYDRRGDS
jgi:hypothetical protein